jgi:propanol-preferring alcohol dehydrogenase
MKEIGKLQYVTLPRPIPNKNEILVKVLACGVCRTDLHVVDGELTNPSLPLIPGHQIVGLVAGKGDDVKCFQIGDRIGIPWLGNSCNHCEFCLNNEENLCDEAKFTGYQINGGFAEYCVADANYCFAIPPEYSDNEAAPLLCAGLIGYRAYKKTEDAQHIGLYGFGAAAHIIIQIADFEKKNVYAFTRPGDTKTQSFAIQLGANWAGDSTVAPPHLLDAAIIFATAGELVPAALKVIRKGGVVVCAGIHMSDIPSFPYKLLWGERKICSIANLTRYDGEEFLKMAAKIPIKTEVHTYPLNKTNQVLDDLRQGRFTGAAVITME